MVSRLVKAMGALSQADDDDTTNQEQQRRKSARLSNRRSGAGGGGGVNNSSSLSTDNNNKDDVRSIHDSGTESDEEEMESIALHRQQLAHFDPFSTYASYNQFLSGGSPPTLTASPPVPKDVDTESWDSFGRESGIMTGDNDSDTDGAATPTPLRRRMTRGDDDTWSIGGGEKRRYSMTMNDHPIAWRLRSFTTEPVRPVKIAARRAPVRILINRPLAYFPPQMEAYQLGGPVEAEIASPELIPAPAPKRNRRNSHRPSLDFEKMVENRIEAEHDDDLPQKPTTRSSH